MLNKYDKMSFDSIAATPKFVLSKKDRGPNGHPKIRPTEYKTMLRRYLHIILLLFTFGSLSAQVTLRAVGDAVDAGNSFELEMRVNNFSTITALEFAVTYDADHLTFNGASDFNLSNLFSSNFNEATPGQINFIWTSIDPFLGDTKPDGSAIFVLNFAAEEDTKSKVVFDFTEDFIIAGQNGTQLSDYKTFNACINHTCIIGQVINDFNQNCIYDTGESGLEDVPIKVSGTTEDIYATSDATGFFSIPTDNLNSVTFNALPRFSAWSPCATNIPINLVNYSENETLSLLVANFGCPHLEVDISAAYAKPCTDIVYEVIYRNNGPAPAFNAEIEVVLDSFITYQGSTLPPIQLQGKTIRFNVGNVNINQTGRFKVFGKVDCIGTLAGQTHCVSAHITPDDQCDPVSASWDESSIQVQGHCVNDSVKFTMTNTGTSDMSSQSDYIIIEDMILKDAGKTQLGQNESETISLQADNHTYRISVNQSLDHPGRSYPTIALEGCGGYNINTNLGSYTEFAEDDANVFLSKDCQESIATPIPNTVRGYPKGYGPNHKITTHDDLEYVIFYKNTCSDTLRQLIFRDTISEYLDIVSIQPGAASYPYDYQLSGSGVAIFDMENVSIPPNGEVFLKFRISQLDQLPTNTVIENRVEIIACDTSLSNTTSHTIAGTDIIDYIMVNTDNPIDPTVKIKVYPNPFVASTTIEIQEYPNTDLRLLLYELNGSLISTQSSQTGQFRLLRDGLSGGTYVFVIKDGAKQIASGQIIIP